MDVRLFWLALGSFAIGAEGFVIASLMPDIAAETGVTLIQGGYLILAFSLAYAIGAPLLAAVTGASDRRRILVGSAVVFALGSLAAALSGSYGALMAARIGMALAAGLYSATAQATAVALAAPEQRARAIAVIVGGTSLAVAFGAPLGAVLAGLVGWRGTYLSVAALSLVAALALALRLPAGLRGAQLTLAERLRVVAEPGVVPALAVTFLYIAGGFVVLVYIAPLAMDAVGLGKAMLPVVLLAFGIGAALGNYAGGQAADRWGATRTVVAASVLNGLALLGTSLVPHLPAPAAGPALIALMFAWGLVAWAFPPAQASRILAIAPRSAPLALSLNGSALYLGIAAGAFVGGQVLEHGTAFDLGWVGALFPAAALVLMRLAAPRPAFVPRLG